MKNPFRRRSPWAGIDMLTLIPVPGYPVERDSGTGTIRVLVPRYTTWPFNRLIQPLLKGEKRHIRVPLESRGSFLWGLIDGKKTIGDMVPLFMDEFPDEKDDVAHRVVMYLFNMYQNRFIGFKNQPGG